MHAARVLHAELRAGLADDALALEHSQLFESLVLEPRDHLALIVVAHPPFECDVAAAARIGELALRAGHVEWVVAEAEARHGS